MEHDPRSDLTEALLDLAGLAAQILAHMARWQGQTAPDAAPPEQVFRELLTETLGPVLDDRSPADIDAARRLMVDAVTRIEEEILLVEPSPRHHEAGRRAQLPRRRP
jgi:hypothetical protein